MIESKLKKRYKRINEYLETKNKAITVFAWAVIAALLVIIGAGFNIQALSSNEFRMPVYTSHSIDTEEHFNFTDKKQVNHPYLTDIFKIHYGAYVLSISIGDILMYLGGAGAIASLLHFVKHALEMWKIKEKISKIPWMW